MISVDKQTQLVLERREQKSKVFDDAQKTDRRISHNNKCIATTNIAVYVAEHNRTI